DPAVLCARLLGRCRGAGGRPAGARRAAAFGRAPAYARRRAGGWVPEWRPRFQHRVCARGPGVAVRAADVLGDIRRSAARRERVSASRGRAAAQPARGAANRRGGYRASVPGGGAARRDAAAADGARPALPAVPPHARARHQGRAHGGGIGRSLPRIRPVQGDAGAAVLPAAAGLAVASPTVRSALLVSGAPGAQRRLLAPLLPERRVAGRSAVLAPPPVPAHGADQGFLRRRVPGERRGLRRARRAARGTAARVHAVVPARPRRLPGDRDAALALPARRAGGPHGDGPWGR